MEKTVEHKFRMCNESGAKRTTQRKQRLKLLKSLMVGQYTGAASRKLDEINAERCVQHLLSERLRLSA